MKTNLYLSEAVNTSAMKSSNYPGGTLEIIGSTCNFTDGVKCFIHEHRPIACRLYPFYPNLTTDNELELLIDVTCPLTESLVMDTAYVSNVISALNKLIPLIDDNYWKMLNHVPSHLWDETCKERRVCILSEKINREGIQGKHSCFV